MMMMMIVWQHGRRRLQRDILTFALSPKGWLGTGGVRGHRRGPELRQGSGTPLVLKVFGGAPFIGTGQSNIRRRSRRTPAGLSVPAGRRTSAVSPFVFLLYLVNGCVNNPL